MKRFAFLLSTFSFLLLCVAHAATYYVDYAAGNDRNTGVDKTQAWKRCPGMVGFSGFYTHAVGDRFVFKGGVEWPFSAFPLTIVSGGAAPAGGFVEYNTATYDYYGGALNGDKSWFTGGSWSKPKFNLAGLSGNGILTAKYVWIDNIDMFDLEGVGGTRHDTSTTPHRTINYGSNATVAFVNCQNGGYARISYCDIHEFRNLQRYVVASASPDGVFGGSPAQPGVEMDHNRLFNSTIPERGCNATYGISYVSFNEAFQISNFCGQGFGFMHDNYAHNFNRTDIPFSDGSGSNGNTGTHGNVFQTFSTSTIYNNVIANVAGDGFLEDGVTPDQGWVSPIDVGQSSTIYNNVLWNVGGQTAIGGFTNFLGGFAFMKVYNNILGPGAFGIHPAATGGAIGLFDVRNNIIITDGTDNPVSFSGTVTQFNHDHNLVISTSQATALGMTTGNRFKPTVSDASIVHAGVDLSSAFNYDALNNARTAPWDLGAYQFGGSAPAPTPTPTPVPTPTPSPTATPTPHPLPLVNGDFETGPFGIRGNVNGWVVSGAGHIAINSQGNTTPSHAAAFSEGGDFTGDVLTQTFVTVPGQVYTLDFDASVFGLRSGSALQLRARVIGATGTVQLNQTVTPTDVGTFTPAAMQWQHNHFAFTADATSAALEFTDIGTGNGSADVMLDTVSITASAPPAPPTNLKVTGP